MRVEGELIMSEDHQVWVEGGRTDEEYLTTKQLAKLTKTSDSLWSKMRWRGEGPPYSYIGSAVRYLRSDIEEYVRANRTTSTSKKPKKPPEAEDSDEGMPTDDAVKSKSESTEES